MKYFRYILLFVGVLLCSHLFAQNVSNADFYQDGKTIVVTYYLDKAADVSVLVSTDGGVTYSAPLRYVSGDVGKNVQPGNKRIVWDVLSEREKLVGDRVIFKVIAGGNSHNGHEYVDLGLPSGTLWATCNVGATKPEGYGDYFAWGETSTKSTYSWSTYKYCNGSYDSQTKYCTKSSYGRVDNKKVLDSSDDAARVNWGGSWRMPTRAEQDELRNKCTWTWTTVNGTKGYRVTGPNGKSIFLPAAGFRYDSSLDYAGANGIYWSSSLYESSPDGAWSLYFNSGGQYTYGINRCYGLSVRPVCSSR